MKGRMPYNSLPGFHFVPNRKFAGPIFKTAGIPLAKRKIQINATATTDVARNIPTYTVDVVPYITKVTTSLSGLSRQDAKKSMFDRTALGHYPVYVQTRQANPSQMTSTMPATAAATESVKIEGFNLGTNATIQDEKETPNSITLSASGASVSIGAMTSGKWTLKVGDIKAINNLNNNGAHGNYSGTTTETIGDKEVYSNYYNRKHKEQ